MIDLRIHDNWMAHFASANRLLIAFSGGLDSSVLLHLLALDAKLHEKIIAVHVNHGISKHANNWEAHCQEICVALGVPCITKRVQISTESNVEETARNARYAVFKELVEEHDLLILAHHRNDQAETLLLQLCRGAGVDGLSAMPTLMPFNKGSLYRPLLNYSREDLVAYAKTQGLTWIDDESNEDCSYSRNFIRHQVIPLLQTRWPGVLKNLSRTASHCSVAAEELTALAHLDYPCLGGILSLEKLTILSWSRINNVLRTWIKEQGVRLPDTAIFNRIIPEVIFASRDANPMVSWDAYCIRRYRDGLYLLKNSPKQLPLEPVDWKDFPNPLYLEEDLGRVIATQSHQGLVIPPGSHIQIRFRNGGETMVWKGKTKTLKQLFQTWGIPSWLRAQIPLLYLNDALASVIGYGVSSLFYQESESNSCWEFSPTSPNLR